MLRISRQYLTRAHCDGGSRRSNSAPNLQMIDPIHSKTGRRLLLSYANLENRWSSPESVASEWAILGGGILASDVTNTPRSTINLANTSTSGAKFTHSSTSPSEGCTLTRPHCICKREGPRTRRRPDIKKGRFPNETRVHEKYFALFVRTCPEVLLFRTQSDQREVALAAVTTEPSTATAAESSSTWSSTSEASFDLGHIGDQGDDRDVTPLLTCDMEVEPEVNTQPFSFALERISPSPVSSANASPTPAEIPDSPPPLSISTWISTMWTSMSASVWSRFEQVEKRVEAQETCTQSFDRQMMERDLVIQRLTETVVDNNRALAHLQTTVNGFSNAAGISGAAANTTAPSSGRERVPEGTMFTHLVRRCYGLPDSAKLPQLKNSAQRSLQVQIEDQDMLIGASNIMRSRTGGPRIIPSAFVEEFLRQLKLASPWVVHSGQRYNAV